MFVKLSEVAMYMYMGICGASSYWDARPIIWITSVACFEGVFLVLGGKSAVLLCRIRCCFHIQSLFCPFILSNEKYMYHSSNLSSILLPSPFSSSLLLLHRIVGKEFGCSVYVSNVVPSSKAAQYGLKVS